MGLMSFSILHPLDEDHWPSVLQTDPVPLTVHLKVTKEASVVLNIFCYTLLEYPLEAPQE